jgi:hypothetical protein
VIFGELNAVWELLLKTKNFFCKNKDSSLSQAEESAKEENDSFSNQTISIEYELKVPSYYNHAKDYKWRIQAPLKGIFILFAKQCIPLAREDTLLLSVQNKCMEFELTSGFLKNLSELEKEGKRIRITNYENVFREARKIFSSNKLFDLLPISGKDINFFGAYHWKLSEKGERTFKNLELQNTEFSFVGPYEELASPQKGKVISY